MKVKSLKLTEKEINQIDKCYFISGDFLDTKNLFDRSTTVGEFETVTYYYKHDKIIGWSDDASYSFFLHEDIADMLLNERKSKNV